MPPSNPGCKRDGYAGERDDCACVVYAGCGEGVLEVVGVRVRVCW